VVKKGYEMNTSNKPYLRSLIGCKDEDYVKSHIEHTEFTDEEIKSHLKRPVKKVETKVKKIKPYMTDDEVKATLSEYGEEGFDDLPDWLQSELRVRNLTWNEPKPLRKKMYKNVIDFSKCISICRKALMKTTGVKAQKIATRLKRYENAQTRGNETTEYYVIDTRINPTEMQEWETVNDAKEHRIMNKELTIKDYLDKYKNRKSLTLIT
jgi:hypothetical protein